MTPSLSQTRNPDVPVVAISYLSFIVLGMPGAMLGVAWSPYMRETFEQPRDAVAYLLVAVTAGYFAASFISGWLMARLSTPILLALSCGIAAIGLFGYALVPSFILLVLVGIWVGAGGGMLDGGMNVYFAAWYGPRLMNWLHASFGIGSTLAPLMMSVILDNDGSWRLGPVVIAILYLITGALFLSTRTVWNNLKTQPHHSGSAPTQHASPRSTLLLPIVWLGIILFIAYAGLELSAGQWAFSLLHEERGVQESVARFWVSIYWGSFTVGRIVFGAIVHRVSPHNMIRGCMIGIAGGAFLLWWNPADVVSFIGLVLYGFMLAPIFALMITNTQERLGPIHAPNAIGFEVAAASIGAGLIPGLAGILADQSSLEVIPPFLVVLIALMAVAYFAFNRPGQVDPSAPPQT